jgi:hypothetical protein
MLGLWTLFGLRELPRNSQETFRMLRRIARLCLVLAGMVFCGLFLLSRFQAVSLWISHLEIHANDRWLGLQWDPAWDKPGLEWQELGKDGPGNLDRSSAWDPPPFPGPATVCKVSWWLAAPLSLLVILGGLFALRGKSRTDQAPWG